MPPGGEMLLFNPKIPAAGTVLTGNAVLVPVLTAGAVARVPKILVVFEAAVAFRLLKGLIIPFFGIIFVTIFFSTSEGVFSADTVTVITAAAAGATGATAGGGAMGKRGVSDSIDFSTCTTGMTTSIFSSVMSTVADAVAAVVVAVFC